MEEVKEAAFTKQPEEDDSSEDQIRSRNPFQDGAITTKGTAIPLNDVSY